MSKTSTDENANGRPNFEFARTVYANDSTIIFGGSWIFHPSLSFGTSDNTTPGNDNTSTSATQERNNSKRAVLVPRQSANGQSAQKGASPAQTTFDPDASITLIFSGPGIQVLGVMSNGTDLISAKYAVDGSNVTTRTVPGLSAGGSLGNQVIFEALGLTDEEHELLINNINATQNRQYIFTGFNQFQSLVSEESKSKHGPNVKAIAAGSVLGGFVLIVLIILGLLHFRRRRIRQLYRKPIKIIDPIQPAQSKRRFSSVVGIPRIPGLFHVSPPVPRGLYNEKDPACPDTTMKNHPFTRSIGSLSSLNYESGDQAIASIGARHGSLDATSISRTLVSHPRSSRSDGGRSRMTQYDNIVRKYREIMDAFHNEVRVAVLMDDDHPGSSVVPG